MLSTAFSVFFKLFLMVGNGLTIRKHIWHSKVFLIQNCSNFRGVLN